MKMISMSEDDLEHLLNCMDNQKFIHEHNEVNQKEIQEIIDRANSKARKLLV